MSEMTVYGKLLSKERFNGCNWSFNVGATLYQTVENNY